MAGIDAVILDFGGVLSQPQRAESVAAMARCAGADLEAFRAAYERHRDAYDAGLPAEEYWRRVLETLGRSPAARDVGSTIRRLIQDDVESWTQYREEVWELVHSFRARGGRAAMLTNGVPEVMARIRSERTLDSWFDAVIVSSEVGCIKPDPRIYRLCLDRLAVAADRALFVDDRAVNVEAAAKLGMQTLHFTGDGAVRDLEARMRPG